MNASLAGTIGFAAGSACAFSFHFFLLSSMILKGDVF
jgi:hypothetical protein